MKKNIYLLLILFLINFSLKSQNKFEFIESEEQLLKKYLKQIFNSRDDLEKKKLNKKVLNIFSFILSDEISFEYPFDSLQFVGIHKSSDNLMRIYNWNLAYNDGSFEYFGFVQYFAKESASVFSKKKMVLYTLTDRSKKIKNPEFKKLSNINWFGALYYEIVVNKYKKQTFYTMIGWDGNDNFSNKKVIDVIYFTEDKSLHFGSNIFDFDNKDKKKKSKRRKKKKKKEKKFYRLIYEFSQKARMNLHYNKEKKMIVFDYLTPPSSTYEGEYQYYGPDGFSYDSFVFRNGKWRYKPDIELRNPKKEANKRKSKKKIRN